MDIKNVDANLQVRVLQKTIDELEEEYNIPQIRIVELLKNNFERVINDLKAE